MSLTSTGTHTGPSSVSRTVPRCTLLWPPWLPHVMETSNSSASTCSVPASLSQPPRTRGVTVTPASQPRVCTP